jgi:hypothetical protein
MNSPYKYKLVGLERQEVTIHRDGAADVTGKVEDAGEDGCTIAVPPTAEEDKRSVTYVFIAYEHIRGIGMNQWDLSET